MSTEVSSPPGDLVEAAAPVVEQSQDAQPTPEPEKMVPLAALEAERAQRQRRDDENAMMKEHLNLLQARQQPPPQPQETVSPDDVMTFGEFDKRANAFRQEVKASLGELQMSKQHPDYDEVIRKYLPEITNDDPELSQTLRTTQNFKLAYRLAKSSEGYQRDHAEQKRSEDANKLIANSERPGSLSAVGGTTPISMAKSYRDMSDSELQAEMVKNRGYA